MKVISIINYKGGVGKTTLTANISAELANLGRKVLMIDLDPQASLTFSFIKDVDWNNQGKELLTIKHWFDDVLNNKDSSLDKYIKKDLYVNNKLKEKLHIIPSHIGLFDVELELYHMLTGKRDRSYTKQKLNMIFCLDKELEKIKDKYDVVIIDCPPSFSLVTQNAIAASDNYIIPTKLDYLSTLGVTTLDTHIKRLVTEIEESIGHYNFKEFNLRAKSLGVVSTMVQNRSGDLISAIKEYHQILERNNLNLFKSKIPDNKTLFGGSSLLPVIMTKPKTPTEDYIINELKRLTGEIINRGNL